MRVLGLIFIDLLFLGKGVMCTSPRQSVPPFWKCVVLDVQRQGFAMLWCYSATASSSNEFLFLIVQLNTGIKPVSLFLSLCKALLFPYLCKNNHSIGKM